ncbi:F-box/LRR-repeat protein 4-like [Cynara cardunculus var. scolymus]|uniref:Leucine-rich repeat, cysteine-containing subtype n=1 Tax=Cynara cardunculus var. scolymus TaxID=59895 RepID=A0A118JT47_CYNCS|nr:F-box/LRR-repeat protein 4-like [Cynara cardunculus var. scolymus]KVH90337.1 Leucine-rich repeat, cysteine-containing subtype [Cynara cardunculus var. scolymus]
MERLGDFELSSIFKRIHNPDDRRSFFQVSKQFLKVACTFLLKSHISSPDFLYEILPASPNLVAFECSKPLSNTHMKLLAQSCPKLQYLKLSLEQNSHPDQMDSESGEFDFDDDGLCAVSNACCHLFEVILCRRLHVGDVGVASLIRSCKDLAILDLSGCVGVKDESLKAIGEASRLSILILHGCSLITDLGLEYLANGDVKNCLEELVLAECDRISDGGIIFLKQMVRLTDLNLSKCGANVTDFGLMALFQIGNFERLNLSWLLNVTDISLFDIATWCLKLTAINLTGCEAVTGGGLCAFANHRTLEEVTLFSCHNFSWEDVELVALTCVRLKYLGISRTAKMSMPEVIQDGFYVINNCWIDCE